MDRYFTKQAFILFAAAFIVLLSACSPAPTAAPTVTRQPTLTQPVKTATRQPTAATTATIAVKTVSPTITRTSTPLLGAGCPAKKPESSLNSEGSDGTYESNQRFFAEILDFLNAGGSRKAVIMAYRQKYSWANQRIIQEKDVTGDGVPELLLTEPNGFVAFVCLNGQYQENSVLHYETYHGSQPGIDKIIDMNHDGIDEIISSSGDMRFRFVEVSTWNGDRFSLLNDSVELPDYYEERVCSVLMGESKVSTRDTDNDGTLELILEQGIPIWSEYSFGPPWRKEMRICKWDGKAFAPDKIEITAPPHYRFQAVQDADRASLQGNYTKALDLYQQTIFNDKLDWWSIDRIRYEVNMTDEERGYNPTPLPSMSADPAEYPTLAAYARFRIMLLHALRGYLPEAKLAYDTLQEKFPAGQTGHVHAEMASAFWLEYQASKNIERSCAKAIDYATLHPADVLYYLGNSQYNKDVSFGQQSLKYEPENICPFH